ncbi:hypothetical protein PsorP6_015705 [Peronosclerospora sorghi]|uniref:Uncharacterized protein n=1 Tax=Peronosclerospora sorghi TaxID=230839 RepID=A0ACC0WNY5_9STRA|nr:hypothetical protein PsorP6_015705 [Peronosclerospora sorghi]
MQALVEAWGRNGACGRILLSYQRGHGPSRDKRPVGQDSIVDTLAQGKGDGRLQAQELAQGVQVDEAFDPVDGRDVRRIRREHRRRSATPLC